VSTLPVPLQDLFIKEIEKIKNSPILAFSVGNYHPVAVFTNLKGNVFKGSFKESLLFINSYLHHHIFSKPNQSAAAQTARPF